MTKHNAPQIAVILLIVAVIIFSNQTVFGQTGTAGGHDEIVKRLQTRLTAIKNDVLTKEITPILNESNEADLGAKLVESYLGSVGKINAAIKGVAISTDLTPQILEKKMEVLKSLGGFFDEIDQKAILIQTYYDALAEGARNGFRSTASTRMANGSKPTIDALRTLGLVCPATQIDLHNRMCFNSYQQVKESLDKLVANRLNPLEQSLENAATNLKRSQSNSGYDSYDSQDSYSDGYSDYSYDSMDSDSMEGSSRPQRPAKLTWSEQVEALVMGTATAEQVKQLTDLLASAMDGMLSEKRDELANLRRPPSGFGRGNFFGSATGGYDEYGYSSSEYSDSPPEYSDSSYRRNAVAPVATINVAKAYLNMDIRYFMVRNLKQMVVEASDANRDALLKAWCAVSSEIGGSDRSWDVFPLLTATISPTSSARESDQTPAGARGMPAQGASSFRNLASAQRNASQTKLELLSVIPGYRSDLRVQSMAVGCSTTEPDLSIQMCFNIGKPVLPLIKLSIPNQALPSQAKVALIEATQYIGDPDSAAFLLPLLTSTDRNIVSAAADAIAAVGDRRASATLVKGLDNPRLAETIVGILKRMGATSSQDIYPMFKSANPVTDKFCVDILKESGDINTLFYLAAILERYHNAPAKKDMPQAEKSELLMMTMEAGVAIISRNMQKAPPALTVPTIVTDSGKPRLDYTLGGAAARDLSGMDRDMGMGMGMAMDRGMGLTGGPDRMIMQDGPPAMPQRSMSPDSYGSDGSTGNSTLPSLERLVVPPEDVQNNAPFVWLDMVYRVAAKHVDDTATIMKDVVTDNSSKKLGTDIRNERIDKDFFRTVINTSEEGLGHYLTNGSDVRKLNVQKDRVIRDFRVYDRELNRIKQRKSSYDIFIEATTGVRPNASGTSAIGNGFGSGTTSPATTNPLGRPL